MKKGLFGLLAVVFLAGSSLVYAQTATRGIPSQADIKSRMDMRLSMMKDALELTPDQQKYWGPIQDAVQSAVQARYTRISAVEQRLSQGGNIDPISVLRARANTLTQRSAELNKLVDAWEPLYRSLNPDQKERVRLLAERMMPMLRVAVFTGRLRGFNEGVSRNAAPQTGGTVGSGAPRQ